MKRDAVLLWALVALAAATRAALALHAPRPFGYAWDLYHEGVVWTYRHGRLPGPADCGECYHPPLYFLCGAPLYGLGAAALKGGAAGGLRLLSWFSMACAAVVIFFTRRTLALLRLPDSTLLLGTALALVFPCLFIASYGAENDALLAALVSAFFFLLCRRYLHPARSGWGEAAGLGLLAGLCALTKYSGWLAPLTLAAVLGPRAVAGARRARAARELGLALAVAVAACGWHYARNRVSHGRLFLGPPWDRDVFDVGAAKVARNEGRYDLRSFSVKDVVALYDPARTGTLDSFPVYDQAFTSLHALAWTDMSFFSVPGRHGWHLPLHYAEGGPDLPPVASTPPDAPREPIYPLKRVSPALVDLVLRLGLIPSLLALAGLAATRARRATRPLALFAVLSVAVYSVWFLAQPAWALKTKYLLFLLPVYAAYSALGVRAAFALDRRLGWAAAAGLIAALAAAEAYSLMFALG